jgi:hypothetical protein
MIRAYWLICGTAKLYDTVATSAPSRNHKANRHGMGRGSSYGLGRRAAVAPSGLLSAASRSSPASRGRSDNAAVKARLRDDADHYDELAAKADRAGAEAEKP